MTNDDGVDAPGILALKQAVDSLGEVFVIAPDTNRSAIGRGITIHDPLVVDEVAMADGTKAFSISGTPVDCVRLGALGLIGDPPDVVVSGANLGLNLGDDVTYSGTVAAALEGVMLGIPAIAVSQDALGGGSGPGLAYDFSAVTAFAAKLVPFACQRRFPRHVIFNVNSLSMKEVNSAIGFGICEASGLPFVPIALGVASSAAFVDSIPQHHWRFE